LSILWIEYILHEMSEISHEYGALEIVLDKGGYKNEK
jgi:hypothetical protein